MSIDRTRLTHRRGAVAVVAREAKLLVIRRSQHVVAPGALCFPGGGIEPGESEEQALMREFREELGASLHPLACIWRSVSPWGVELAWWQGSLEPGALLAPNAQEVEFVHWLTPDEIAALPDLLESNRAFLDQLARGAVELGSRTAE